MDPGGLIVRDATSDDTSAIALLHVVTFVQTHGEPGPTYELRESQWREAFAKDDGTWFCLVIESPKGDLVGFAKGMAYGSNQDDLPGFAGELNKLYLLREYQRRGLGRKIVREVARRFLNRNIRSMLLFGDARSPSNAFYEALGAEKLFSRTGDFHGGYGWRDLQQLAEACAIEHARVTTNPD